MYSFKDFTGQILKDKTDMSNQIITGSCFSQETPNTHVFPDDMTGTTFIDCNLDNVYIPQGNTVQGGRRKRFSVQNDLRDWIIDENDNPIEPVSKKYWEMEGYPVTPDCIPVDFMRRETILECDYLKDKNTAEFMSWFYEAPVVIDTKTRDNEIEVSSSEFNSMVDSKKYCPFIEMPSVVKKINDRVVLRGLSKYVTIQGKGKFKGGIGYRPYNNKIEDLK